MALTIDNFLAVNIDRRLSNIWESCWYWPEPSSSAVTSSTNRNLLFLIFICLSLFILGLDKYRTYCYKGHSFAKPTIQASPWFLYPFLFVTMYLLFSKSTYNLTWCVKQNSRLGVVPLQDSHLWVIGFLFFCSEFLTYAILYMIITISLFPVAARMTYLTISFLVMKLMGEYLGTYRC